MSTSGSPLLPGTEVIWFILFMTAFYALQLPLRRLWQLSLEGVWLTGFAALAVTFYFRVGINLLLLTGVCLALLVIVEGIWLWVLRHALTIKRELPPEATAGTPLSLTYHLTNRSPSWLVNLGLQDRALRGILTPSSDTLTPGQPARPLGPKHVTVAELDSGQYEDDPFDHHPNQRGVPALPALRVFLRPRETVTIERTATFPGRGLYRLGPVELLMRDPLGLHAMAAVVPAWDTIRILPYWRPLTYLPRELQTYHRQEEETSDEREGLSTEFRGIRDYQPGDPLKSVHWPLTAKHQQLVVRQYEQLVGEAWGIILDCHESPELGLGQQSDQERAISLVASLTATLEDQGRPYVCILAMQRPVTLQSPSEGLTHQEVLRTLASVRFDARSGLDLALMEAHRQYPELPWLLITTRASGDVIDALRALQTIQPIPVACLIDHASFSRTLSLKERFGMGDLPSPEQVGTLLDAAQSMGARIYRVPPEVPLAHAFEPAGQPVEELV